MKVIIAGSRHISNYYKIKKVIEMFPYNIDIVISGKAKGVDRAGEVWGANNDKDIISFPADWFEHGKAAGLIRNTQMAKKADALIACWDGQSTGTKDMINKMKDKPTLIGYFDDNGDIDTIILVENGKETILL